MIVAVSSGLVAGVAVPAGAVTHAAAGGASPQTASVPLLTESASTTALAAGADTRAAATRDVASVSRSLARTAYLASRPATVGRASSAGTLSPSPAPVP